MTCSKSIVECLREKGINPRAYSNGEYDDNYLPKFALVYDKEKWFHTKKDGNYYFWYVDFIKPVVIESYQMITDPGCNWITKWKASVSFNAKNWKEIDSKELSTPPVEKNYSLNHAVNARYFKIDGSSHLCPQNPESFALNYVKFFGLYDLICGNVCTCNKNYVSISFIFRRIMFISAFLC